MRLFILVLLSTAVFAQNIDPQKTMDSLEKINASKIPEYCETCTARKTESPPIQPSDPVPYTCELEELPKLEVELNYLNDNYLYGLKDITQWKDGNDFGKTFEIGLVGTYRSKEHEVSAHYQKVLFSTRQLDGQYYYRNTPKDPFARVARQVDVDRIRVNLKKRWEQLARSKAEFYVEGAIGFESRKRDTGSGVKIQNVWHNVLDVRKYEYIGPEAIPAEKIPAEHLKEPILEKAALLGGAAGVHQVYFKGKCTMDAKAGALVVSDANRFISQNSNVFFKGSVKGSFGKKTKIEPILAQSLLVYAKSAGDSHTVGANTEVGAQVKISREKAQYEPFFLMSIPMGRQEFPEFNDRDKLLTMGLRVKFLKTTPK